MVLCGALTVTSVERSVWMCCWNQEWLDSDGIHFTDTIFFHSFQNYNSQTLFTSGFTTSGFL